MIRHRLVDQHDYTMLVTISRASAEEERDRSADFAPGSSIATEDIEIVGRFGSSVTDGRVLWADGRVSSAWEFDPRHDPDAVPPPAIAEAASHLLATIYGADGPSCAAVGGPLVVATVLECVTTVIARDPRRTRGGYQSPIVERLDVALADGRRHTWYAGVVGYGEGYLYALQPTYEAAVAELEGHDAQLEAVS
jgi:hypothetical protein